MAKEKRKVNRIGTNLHRQGVDRTNRTMGEMSLSERYALSVSGGGTAQLVGYTSSKRTAQIFKYTGFYDRKHFGPILQLQF